jgi:hypothetical protein
MEEKAKFKIIYSKDADDFLNNLPTKIKDKREITDLSH